MTLRIIYEPRGRALEYAPLAPSNQPEDGSNIGLGLVILASAISVLGVCYNNIVLDHTAAMLVWRWSNIIFVLYFVGRWRKWWDGGMSDFVMFCLYMFFVASNEYGLLMMGL